MNPGTHAALQTLTCGVDHDVVLIESDGSPFLESEGVQFYKMKYDADLPESERYYPSRQKSLTTGILLEPVHDPADMEYLRISRRTVTTVLTMINLTSTGPWYALSGGNTGTKTSARYASCLSQFHPDDCLTLLIVPSLMPKGMMVTSIHGSAKTRSLGAN